MKSLTEHLWFEVPSSRGFINIKLTVEELVSRSGVSVHRPVCRTVQRVSSPA